MPESALSALYHAVGRRLTEQSELWNDRAYPDLAREGTDRPYVIFAWAAGGEVNGLVRPDAEFVLTVECRADSQAEAFTAAARISALLNDSDLASDTPLDGGTDWLILNCSQEQAIHLVEVVDGAWVYRDGHRFRFSLESR